MKTEKRKLTLQQKLAKRKIKKPNWFIYFLYYFIMTKFVGRKYKAHYEIIDDINKCKGPKFLIWNHLSRVDHMYLMEATYPTRINILAGYNEFFRSHLHLVFKLNQITPKKHYTNDIPSIKALNSLIKQGATICMAPEGMSSIYGTNQPIVPGTAHFLKHHKIPVYYMELRGQYLVSTKAIQDERYGNTYAKLMLLFSREDIERLSEQEITDILNEKFRHDEYLWNKEQRIEYKHKGNELARNLSTLCYKCPKCGSDIQMEEDGNSLRCKCCGNSVTVNDYYDFIPNSIDAKYPISPSKWVEWERCKIIKEIRNNPDYSFSCDVKLGYLPPYKYVSDKKTSEICGEGKFSLDHRGIHYRGTKLGENFDFDLSYKAVYSLPIVTDTTFFSVYVKEEYHDVFPIEPVTIKLLLIVEEMHRLHVNLWKNFSWNDYMYDESLDDKKLDEIFFSKEAIEYMSKKSDE